MTEEIIVEGGEAPAPRVESTPEPTPFESSAREQGWVSKEEWVAGGKDEAEWRPAREFVERGELYKSIHSTKRELKQAQQALTALQKHHQYVFEKAHRQALDDLKREKRQAMRNEDIATVADIDEKIEELQAKHEEERNQIQPVPVQPTVPPEFSTWVERNTWYERDSELREFADATGIVFAQKNPGIAPSEVLRHVEEKIKKQFPDKFGVKRTAPNPTAAPSKTAQKGAPSKGDPREDQLDETARGIMNTLIKSKQMTKEQYLKEYFGE